MNISVTDAKARLTELVRRAEAGEEIVLTRRGKPVARLSAATGPERRKEGLKERLLEIGRRAAAKAKPGPSAARSQDFLYDEWGAPKNFDWDE
jgi:prevent-host-death family protein